MDTWPSTPVKASSITAAILRGGPSSIDAKETG